MKTKTNNRKKLGVIAVLLVMLIAIGVAAGTTFAKYISSASVESQQATVAKWGFTLTANAPDLFATDYGNASDSYATALPSTSSTAGVVSSASVTSGSRSKVVAPGTKGSAKFISINGSAEVDSVLKIVIDKNFATPKLSNGTTANDYYPLVWKINGTRVGNASTGVVTANDFATTIKTLLQAALPSGVTATTSTDTAGNYVLTVELPANTGFSSAFEIEISWEWPYESSSTSDDEKKAVNDKDTLLGSLTAGTLDRTEYKNYYDNSVTTASIGISTTIEQVQKFPSQQN